MVHWLVIILATFSIDPIPLKAMWHLMMCVGLFGSLLETCVWGSHFGITNRVVTIIGHVHLGIACVPADVCGKSFPLQLLGSGLRLHLFLIALSSCARGTVSAHPHRHWMP